MDDVIIDSSVKMPVSPRPIMIIGAGGIVRDAHLPAYTKARWNVRGIYDPVEERAGTLAAKFKISNVYSSIEEMVRNASGDVVFDIAVPAAALRDVLPLIPPKSAVMIQKPFGCNIQEATALRDICKEKQLTAAVNFQKRFIPAVLAAKRLIDGGVIGDLHHMEIRMNIYTPWHLWNFLFGIPRMEMLYHSIHYVDLMRYFFGDPGSVYAKTVKHPGMMELASVRSVIILDYGDVVQSFINTNHGHVFGTKYQDAFIKWEGTKGAIRHTLGMNINFPEGSEDTFEVCLLQNNASAEWRSYDIEGKWYPDAFVGSMANLMCYAEGSEKKLVNSIDSAYRTMQVVEAAYLSNEHGGVPVNN
jgi:predicted dehydrogenase